MKATLRNSDLKGFLGGFYLVSLISRIFQNNRLIGRGGKTGVHGDKEAASHQLRGLVFANCYVYFWP